MAGKKKISRPQRKKKYEKQKVRSRQNKVRNIEKKYKILCKASRKAKEAKKARSFYFHEKYPTLEKYQKSLTQRKN